MKGFTLEKKWERLQNSRKGFRMTISKQGSKEKEKESFQCFPSAHSDYSIALDKLVTYTILSFTHTDRNILDISC